jgi:hypothetical protein
MRLLRSHRHTGRAARPPAASLKRTKIRFVAGSNGTLPVPCTKIPNVGVALALIVVITLLIGGAKHAPVVGLV